ncbi:MAG TPA: hypothetical protein ENN32_08945 [Chloroflexi bacterium]|nr:hypothetical protein [Chloroflexota bacterium]
MRKKFVPILLVLLVGLLLIVGACKSKADGDSPEAVYTQAALTAEALLTKRAVDSGEEEPAPTATPTEIADSTATPRTATATLRPETEEEPSNTATTAPGSCTLAASFVKDVTIDDGTQLRPGEAFTKTWQVMNAGTCTWGSGYTLFFLSGDQMSAPASVSLSSGIDVAPGTLINISVDLVAPVEPGEYRGDFKFKDASGKVFGINPNAAGSVYVKIAVVAATPTPTTAPTATPTVTVEATAEDSLP